MIVFGRIRLFWWAKYGNNQMYKRVVAHLKKAKRD
jgi:hypothetical protein